MKGDYKMQAIKKNIVDAHCYVDTILDLDQLS